MHNQTRSTAFRTAHTAELQRLLKGYRQQLLGDCVPFWEDRVLDREHGGYFAGFDRQGNLTDDRKAGWFVGRTMYTFAALYNDLEPRASWRELAAAGRQYLDTGYAGNGRFHQMLNRKGEVLAGTVSLFTDHFAVKGLYEYLRMIGAGPDHPDVAFARMLTDTLFANAKDPQVLAVECPPGLQKHAVTFMTLLVAQESAHLFGNAYKPVVDEYLHRSLYVFANDEYAAPLEYVDDSGKLYPTGCGRLVDAGHTMESMWFAMAEGRRRGDTAILRRAETVIDWVIRRCYDEAYGGFLQHCDIELPEPEGPFRSTDYAGVPAAWDDKIWWVQAEALLALGMSALLNENETHYRYFRNMHDYVETVFRDPTWGEWYAVAGRDGTISCDWKGSVLKGAYHVPRCLLKLVQLLEGYLAGDGATQGPAPTKQP